MDRDVLAAMNLSVRGLARFASSQGAAGEAMRRNSESVMPVILGVDAAKLSLLSVMGTRWNLKGYTVVAAQFFSA
jgi:hypothetical protein